MPKPVNEMTPRERDEEIIRIKADGKWDGFDSETVQKIAPDYAQPSLAWGLLMELSQSDKVSTAEAVKQAYVSWKRGEG